MTRVGVMLPSFRETPSEAMEVAARAERVGLDGVFVYDHLWPMGSPQRPSLAPFPLLGGLAASTSRLHIGPLVARVGIVPDEILIAQFAALHCLAPGRVIGALGTGDRLSFNENRAYGLSVTTAQSRRAQVARCAQALLELHMEVWVGGYARATVAVAETVGAAANFWEASAEHVAAQAARSEVTWAGMARAGREGRELGPAELLAIAAPLAQAGASWLVFGWPVGLEDLAHVAEALRR